MVSDQTLLRVRGTEIVDARDRPIRLRGFCLGGWLNMENFITGYPGSETGFRKSIAAVLGDERARFFFDRFLTHFVAEDDVRYIKELGATVVRVALNYRHFEDDDRPFEYREGGFGYLDRLIEWCRAHRVYVILDLHAAQGWQNPDWHSDNPGVPPLLWEQRQFQDRFVALWRHLAGRYRDDPVVAGYNVLNEPVAPNMAVLNALYQRVTNAIREVDAEHIIFLEGNMLSTEFDGLADPFDANTVYSSHHYALPGISDAEYPGMVGGEEFDRDRLAQEIDERNAFMRRHGVPTWVGEFGSNYLGGRFDPYRLQVTKDMLDIFESRGYHWTIWTYKDVGLMGTVYAAPDSAWMQRTLPVRRMYQALRCDTWYIGGGEVDALLDQLVDLAKRVCGDDKVDGPWLTAQLRLGVRGTVFPQLLLPLFAEQFRGMGEDEIDRMMQSFRLDRCVRRGALVDALKGHMLGEVTATA